MGEEKQNKPSRDAIALNNMAHAMTTPRKFRCDSCGLMCKFETFSDDRRVPSCGRDPRCNWTEVEND